MRVGLIALGSECAKCSSATLNISTDQANKSRSN